jgi:hypothetical protein
LKKKKKIIITTLLNHVRALQYTCLYHRSSDNLISIEPVSGMKDPEKNTLLIRVQNAQNTAAVDQEKWGGGGDIRVVIPRGDSTAVCSNNR